MRKPYVIEGNPRFTDEETFLGSDYLLKLLASDPSKLQKRLGDGWVEQRRIEEQLLAQGMGDNYNLNAQDEKNERKAFLNTVTTLTSLSAQVFQLDGAIAGSTASNAVENNFLHDVCLVNPDLPQCQGLPGAGMEKVKLKSVTAQVGAFGLAVNATVDENGVSGGFSKTLIGKEPNKVGVSLMFEIDTGVNLPTPSTNRSSAAFSGTYCGPSFTCVGGGRDIKTGNQTFQFGFGTPVFSPSIDINPHN